MKFKETESCTVFTKDQHEENLKHNQNLYHHNWCFLCFWCEKKRNRNEKLAFERYEVSENMYQIFPFYIPKNVNYMIFDFCFVVYFSGFTSSPNSTTSNQVTKIAEKM